MGQPAVGHRQSRCAPFDPSEGPFMAQMLEKPPQLRAGRDSQLLLQHGAIHRSGWVEEGIVLIAPAFQPTAAELMRQLQDQGREVRFQVLVELKAVWLGESWECIALFLQVMLQRRRVLQRCRSSRLARSCSSP